jgi:hypothetical protein
MALTAIGEVPQWRRGSWPEQLPNNRLHKKGISNLSREEISSSTVLETLLLVTFSHREIICRGIQKSEKSGFLSNRPPPPQQISRLVLMRALDACTVGVYSSNHYTYSIEIKECREVVCFPVIVYKWVWSIKGVIFHAFIPRLEWNGVTTSMYV